MRTRFLIALFLIGAAVASVGGRQQRQEDAKKQVQFGITVAQRGLWREAIYRWQRAAELDPTYAEALNDLAIAYEHEGDLARRRAWRLEKALAIEPDSPLVAHQAELRALQGNQ